MKQMATDVNVHLATKDQNVQMEITVQGIRAGMVELVWTVLDPSPATALKTTVDQDVG